MSNSLWPHRQHTRLPCPSLSLRVCPNSCLLVLSNCLILCLCLILSFFLQSFQASRSFPMSQPLHIRWSKYWTFIFSISPCNEYSGLISFRISLRSKGISRVFYTTTVQKNQYFSTQPSLWSNSHLYITTGKTIALTIRTFFGKVMSLLFNRFIIAFLPRRKCETSHQSSTPWGSFHPQGLWRLF